MSARELVVLGTASQAPTRTRNHNGHLLRWDGAGFLFDPGEGTQRQLLLAGVPSSAVTRLCVSHFHGDHCPGPLQGPVASLRGTGAGGPFAGVRAGVLRPAAGRVGVPRRPRPARGAADRRRAGGLRTVVDAGGPPAGPPRRDVRLPAGRARRPPDAARGARPRGGGRAGRRAAPAGGAAGRRRADRAAGGGERAASGAAGGLRDGHPAVRRGPRAGRRGRPAGHRVDVPRRGRLAGPRVRTPDRAPGGDGRGRVRGAPAGAHPLLPALPRPGALPGRGGRGVRRRPGGGGGPDDRAGAAPSAPRRSRSRRTARWRGR
ncbi:Metallo-beta-lactamase superfamily protein [Geodermatophilus obscurus]|uniref:Metallo-beta-lactamase superfamily protein n=1 Tax=Geodermatophilus obscurus TaxID=1861 RepID=A0A1M7S9M0_9ACTN|nr:Metallo-beta-lactamase superfamily protein [Geodermatophilus obscurus]